MKQDRYNEQYIKPYRTHIEELEGQQRKLLELYQTINSEGFQQIRNYFERQKQNAIETYDSKTDKNILSIWFALKAIWQSIAIRKSVDSFFGWINSIPNELDQVSQELNRLTKTSSYEEKEK